MRVTVLPFITLAAAACGGFASAPSAPVPDDARVAAVLAGLRPPVEITGRAERWTLEERMAHHGVPGVSIAVIEDGRIAWSRGVGETQAGSGVPVTTTTLFQAGSISKPLTATAMLRLVETGALDLDADVNQYLESWRVPTNEFTSQEKVTLRRLASHSAGVTVNGFRGYAPGSPLPTLVQVLNGAEPANSPPIEVDVVPGSAFRYSGGGYVVMQQVLTDVTGEPFEGLMRRLVFDPIGMERSTYGQPLPAARQAETARGHDPTGAPVPGGWHVLPEQAAAGLWSTAGELAQWAASLGASYTGRPGGLLTQQTARTMLTPQMAGAGLGLPVSGEGRGFGFTHAGSNVGFIAVVAMFPEIGSGVAIMTNGVNGDALSQELIRAIAAEYGWPRHGPQVVTAVPLDATLAARLAGNYTLQVGPGRPVEVRLEDGALTLHGPADMVQPLVPLSATSFISPATGWRIEFAADGSTLRVLRDATAPPIDGVRATGGRP